MNGSTGRWVGIDVAKSKLDVALLDERGKVKSKRPANPVLTTVNSISLQ